MCIVSDKYSSREDINIVIFTPLLFVLFVVINFNITFVLLNNSLRLYLLPVFLHLRVAVLLAYDAASQVMGYRRSNS
jgi:hypothetical protein